jgi:uncharacterized phage-associated protein
MNETRNRFDTSIHVEDERTSSDETMRYEKNVGSFDLDRDTNTTFGSLEDDEWQESHTMPLESSKVSALDVAAYILGKTGPMSTMKLQKLVYYSQAWSLVWDEKPLFEEDIEAWANGPVVRKLFDYHRGMYQISSIMTGNPRLLNKEQRDTIDAVLDYYGDKTAQWLIELSHSEDPWIQARKGLPAMERGQRVMPLDVMAAYYSSLLVNEDAEKET